MIPAAVKFWLPNNKEKNKDKDRKFNRTTADKAADDAIGRRLRASTQEARWGGTWDHDARTVRWREALRLVGKGKVQEPPPVPVALVDGEVRH